MLKVSRVPPGLRPGSSSQGPGCSFHGHGVKRKDPALPVFSYIDDLSEYSVEADKP